MRKIEEEMLTAIGQRKDWTKANTSLFIIPASESGNPYGCRAEVYLHNNYIGSWWYGNAVGKGEFKKHDGKFEPCVRTFKEYPTPTTRSRLRALGVDASIKGGKACINGEVL